MLLVRFARPFKIRAGVVDDIVSTGQWLLNFGDIADEYLTDYQYVDSNNVYHCFYRLFLLLLPLSLYLDKISGGVVANFFS